MSQTALTHTTDGYPLDDKLRELLVETYGNCSPAEKEIIQFLALLYMPLPRVALLQGLNQLEVADDEDKLFKSASLSVYINRLLQQGVLIQERSQGPRCHPLLREIAVVETEAEGKFDGIVEVIQQHWSVRQWRGQDCRNYQTPFEFVRDIRIAVYQQDYELLCSCARDFEASYRWLSILISVLILYLSPEIPGKAWVSRNYLLI